MNGAPFGRTARHGSLCAMTLVLAGSSAEASLLSEILDRIAKMGPSPLAAIMVNASVNAPIPLQTPRYLADGMRVIIGYDALGRAVEATAGASGLLVTPETSSGLQSGLAAGLYPVGSAVFSLPPAGQLSLYEADRNGARLERAQEAVLAVVDGSITTIIDGILLPDLAPVQAMASNIQPLDPRLVDMSRVSTTVLGAVNSGEIVSAIEVDRILGETMVMVDIAGAEIATGHSVRIDQAINSTTQSVDFAARHMGGANDIGALIVNIGLNASMVTGSVVTRVTGQSTEIASITTTVIGAVNSGIVLGDE